MRSAEQRSEEPELDELTLLRAQRGDRAAQTALVERYQRPVFALLSRMLGGQRTVVEDLAQETFLRALRALPSYDARGPARLCTWMLTIASRLVIDHLRVSGSHARGLGVVAELPSLAPAERPDQQVQRRALREALARAVGELPAPFQAAFLLRELHGLAYEEIAQTLQIDVGTVKSRLGRARANLQEALTELRDE